ncbi:MAG TPA: sigma-70 family RNA polymerase sigma factor [Chthonomonadales bacterium]|nr:sigma-70 family RNA polymerase sigma factor [Chthonomonadales bacterium]
MEISHLPPALRIPYVKAKQQARQAGLTGDDFEDCMMEFLVRILTGNLLLPPSLPSAWRDAWWMRVAHHHTLDFLEQRGRVRSHEVSADESILEGVPDTSDLPETPLLRGEARKRVRACLSQLSPYHQGLLLRHHVRRESIKKLAAFYHRTPGAIAQALCYARKRLRRMLMQEQEREGAP